MSGDRASRIEQIANRYAAGAKHIRELGVYQPTDLDALPTDVPSGFASREARARAGEFMAAQLKEVAARVRGMAGAARLALKQAA